MKKYLVTVLLLTLCGVAFAGELFYIPKEIPADPQPVPAPVPTPPPPVQTTTTEHGQRAVYATETNWHFSKPIAAYGTFDLFVGGKKITVSMAYKDSEIEVRNSESKKNMVVIAPASFKDKTAYVSYPSGGSPTPAPEPAPAPTPVDGTVEVNYKDIIHHFNPMSFEDKNYPKGRGMTILFCVGDKYDAVSFIDDVTGEDKWHNHNRNDEGREAWTNVDWKGKDPTFRSGTVIAKSRNGKTYSFRIPGGGKSYLDYKGKCFGKR